MTFRAPYFNWIDKPDAIALVKREWAKGTPAKEIGVLLGVSAQSIISKARVLQLEPRGRGQKPGNRANGLRRYWEQRKMQQGAQP